MNTIDFRVDRPGAGDAYSYPALAERMAEVAQTAVASARARRPAYP